jgi:transposase-like protein
MERRGWRQWTEQDAREALAELARSGESLAAFARRRGVSGERVRYWRKRLADGAPAFVAIPVGSDRQGPRIEVTTAEMTLRVREDIDLEHLSALIEVVARHGRGC